jgi:hypothetical protein
MQRGLAGKISILPTPTIIKCLQGKNKMPTKNGFCGRSAEKPSCRKKSAYA